MSYILGLSTMGASAAALFKDGKLLAAVEEERLSRLKNDNRFPHLSIEEVLSIANITLENVDTIAVYWQPWRIWSRGWGVACKMMPAYSNNRKAIISKLKELFTPSHDENEGSWLDLFHLRKILLEVHGPTQAKIKYWDHHLTHQLYGEVMRDWDQYVSLSYDGGGESYSTVVSVVRNGKREIISRHRWPNSLGHFYSTFTGYLGFKMLEGEYKMMGLAPYGKPIWKDLILEKILLLKENGHYKLDTKLCDYHAALKNEFSSELEKYFGPPRLENENPTETHINLAASVQAAFEEALTHILRPVHAKYSDLRHLVITGGCALNVTANGKVLTTGWFDEVIIPPAPHDAGCAIGAGLCSLNNNFDLASVRSPYQGRMYNSGEILDALSEYGILPSPELDDEDLIKSTASLLAQGKLVAWFQGRSEFGPRALGARSFLADPRKDQIRDDINRKIKKRELFRPFAPSVTQEAAENMFSIGQDSPYMNIVARVKNTSVPAITHIDSTARVHTVTADANPRYHSLIKRFGEITGVSVLLNTSFNIQEPIVYSPSDAIKTFLDSEVDVLVIENYLIKRSDLEL
jgi:carbamoyltransferase